MKLETTDKGQIVLKEVFSSLCLETADGEKLYVSMRDQGFELRYIGGGSRKEIRLNQGEVDHNEAGYRIQEDVLISDSEKLAFLTSLSDIGYSGKRMFRPIWNGETYCYDKEICAKLLSLRLKDQNGHLIEDAAPDSISSKLFNHPDFKLTIETNDENDALKITPYLGSPIHEFFAYQAHRMERPFSFRYLFDKQGNISSIKMNRK